MDVGEAQRTEARNQSYVLVIGSELARRAEIARAVEGAGFNVWERNRDDRALATDEAARAIAIIFDATAVGPSGADVRALRLAERLRTVPVLAVTPLGDREARAIVLAAGADDFVDAPVDRTELRTRLTNLIRRRTSTPPAANVEGDVAAARRAERELRTVYRASQLLQGPFRPLPVVLHDLAAIVAESLEAGGTAEVRLKVGADSGETADFAWTRPSWSRVFDPTDGIEVQVDVGYHKGIGPAAARRGPRGREVEVIESIVEHLSLHLQRRRAEEGQRFAEAAIDTSVTAIAFSDLDGKMTYVNRACVELWGYDVPADVVGRPLLDFWDDAEQTLAVGRALKKNGSWMGELRGRHRRGKPLHLLLTASTVVTPGGATRLMSTMQDITALKWHEARLAENVELLRAVVQAAPIVLLSTDRHGKILLSEGSALSLFGQKPGQGVGRSVFELYRDVEGLVDGIVRALDGERTQIRVRLGELWFDAVFAPRMDASGVQTGVVGVCVDVTQRLRLEEELLQSQKMQAIGLLAGGVAHDFNNVLTVILAHASLLLDRAGDEGQRRGIETVLDAARRAEGLTRQLLLFSRREVAFRHPLDVAEVVRGTTRMLSRLIGEDIKVRTRLIAGAPHVLADKGQVEQVLMNLVVNARDAMPRGGELVIEAGPTKLPEGVPRAGGAPPGEYAFIRVSDTGTGMDEKTRSRIFEPFFTTKAPGRGTGLGLSTVYGIVERSGGHIHVESEVGAGSTFWVLFPAHAGAGEGAGDVPPSNVVTPRRDVTILLVEDEGEVRRVTERCLLEAGHRVLSAASASEALRLAAEHQGKIELLLSDVVMPDMSGPVLARRLRERIPGLRILFITGYTDDTALRYGVDQNLVELLSKPFTPDELARRVSQVMADEVRPQDEMLRSWAETARAETA